MSQVVNSIYKIFDNLLKYNNTDIVILFDNNNKLWFSLSDTFRAIGYVNSNREIKRLTIDEAHIKTFKTLLYELPNNIRENLKIRKNVQPHMKMTDEAGIYVILNKSNKPIAQKFKDELFSNILPTLREKGEYKFSAKDKAKLNNIKQTIKLIKTSQKIHNTTKRQYDNKTGNGFIYILKVKTIQNGESKQCYKIGYTQNLNNRLATYKTGNPDVELVHQENVKCNKKQLEKCVLNLNILNRISSNNEVICDKSLKEIKKEIEDCKVLISEHSI